MAQPSEIPRRSSFSSALHGMRIPIYKDPGMCDCDFPCRNSDGCAPFLNCECECLEHPINNDHLLDAALISSMCGGVKLKVRDLMNNQINIKEDKAVWRKLKKIPRFNLTFRNGTYNNNEEKFIPKEKDMD